VAPLLVLLPFVVGQGETDYNAIAFLTAKVKSFLFSFPPLFFFFLRPCLTVSFSLPHPSTLFSISFSIILYFYLLLQKATLGFGSVVWLGSSVLSKIFALVAQARSTDTFVALCLLVSVSRLTVQRLLFT
jgi:hypothetical protein